MTLQRVPLFTALEPNLVASGLTPDQHELLTPLWVDASSLQFVDGKVRRRRNNQRITRVDSGAIVGLSQQFLSNGDKVYWIVGGRDLWRWDKFSIENQAELATLGQVSPYADITHYGDWTFINTGVGQPLFHQGASGLQAMPELPSDFATMTKFLNYVMCIGTGSKKNGVTWHNSRDIFDWTPATTNDAGTLYVDQMNSPLKAAISYGQRLLIFAETQVAEVSYIGSPFYFGQRLLFDQIGVCGKKAVTTDGAAVYGMSRDGAFAMTLQEYRFIDEERIQTYFQENVNWGVQEQIIVARNDTQRTIDFLLPMHGSAVVNEGWSFDPTSGSWSPIDPVRFQDSRQVDQYTVAGESNGDVVWLEAGVGGDEPLVLETRPLLLQGRTMSGVTENHLDVLVQEVDLLLKSVENVQMAIGSTNDLNAGFTWTDWIDLVEGQVTYLVPEGLPSGAYWKLKFQSILQETNVTSGGELVTATTVPVTVSDPDFYWNFNLQGFMLYGELEGTRDAE